MSYKVAQLNAAEKRTISIVEYINKWEMSMERLFGQQRSPDVSAEQRASSELIKQIRKLRWIGKEEDAKTIQLALGSAPHADGILAVPRDTD